MKYHWILIRGLVREVRHWDTLPDQIRELGHEVTCLELPGVGQRYQENPPLTIASYVDDLRPKLQAISATKPFALLAVSMGGMIGLNWLSRYPDDFSKAVIINSSSRLSPVYYRIRPTALKMLLKLFIGAKEREREKQILEETTNLINVSKERVDRWYSYARECPIRRATFLRQIFSAAKFCPPDSLQTDITFISSTADRFTNYKCSELLAKRFSAPLFLHNKAGHDLALDDPQWVISHL